MSVSKQVQAQIVASIEIMNRGQKLRKFGRKGKPHDRIFRINSEATKIYWVTKDTDPESSGLELSKVSGVQRGRNTEVFLRYKKKSTSELEQRSFSLMYGKKRSLDIECKNRDQCDMWVSTLQFLINQLRKAGVTRRNSLSNYSVSDSHMIDVADLDSEMSFSLNTNPGEIILSGWLEKKNHDAFGNYKKRYFALRMDHNLYYYGTDVIKYPRSKPKGVIPVTSIQKICKLVGKKRKHIVQLQTKSREYILGARDERDQQRWIGALNKAHQESLPSSTSDDSSQIPKRQTDSPYQTKGQRKTVASYSFLEEDSSQPNESEPPSGGSEEEDEEQKEAALKQQREARLERQKEREENEHLRHEEQERRRELEERLQREEDEDEERERAKEEERKQKEADDARLLEEEWKAEEEERTRKLADEKLAQEKREADEQKRLEDEREKQRLAEEEDHRNQLLERAREAETELVKNEEEENLRNEERRRVEEEERQRRDEQLEKEKTMKDAEERLRVQQEKREQVGENLKALEKGAMMMKYGRKGRPHQRFFCIDGKASKFIWAPKSSGVPVNSFQFEEISRVQKGRDTKVFDRYKSKINSDLIARSFSIIYGDRSLDIECRDEEQCNIWVSTLQHMIPGDNQNVTRNSALSIADSVDSSDSDRIPTTHLTYDAPFTEAEGYEGSEGSGAPEGSKSAEPSGSRGNETSKPEHEEQKREVQGQDQTLQAAPDSVFVETGYDTEPEAQVQELNNISENGRTNGADLNNSDEEFELRESHNGDEGHHTEPEMDDSDEDHYGFDDNTNRDKPSNEIISFAAASSLKVNYGRVEAVHSGRCMLCMAKILGDGVSADDHRYHTDCFTCLKCGTELSSDNFVITDLGPMCSDHGITKLGASPRTMGFASQTSSSTRMTTDSNIDQEAQPGEVQPGEAEHMRLARERQAKIEAEKAKAEAAKKRLKDAERRLKEAEERRLKDAEERRLKDTEEYEKQKRREQERIAAEGRKRRALERRHEAAERARLRKQRIEKETQEDQERLRREAERERLKREAAEQKRKEQKQLKQQTERESMELRNVQNEAELSTVDAKRLASGSFDEEESEDFDEDLIKAAKSGKHGQVEEMLLGLHTEDSQSSQSVGSHSHKEPNSTDDRHEQGHSIFPIFSEPSSSSAFQPVGLGQCQLCLARINMDNRGFKVGGTPYHEDCFNCLKCGKSLSPDDYIIGELGPLCIKHSRKDPEHVEPLKSNFGEPKPISVVVPNTNTGPSEHVEEKDNSQLEKDEHLDEEKQSPGPRQEKNITIHHKDNSLDDSRKSKVPEAFMIACRSGDARTASKLLQTFEFDPNDHGIKDALIEAANNGHPEIVALMYKRGVLFAQNHSPRSSPEHEEKSTKFLTLNVQLKQMEDTLEKKNCDYKHLAERFQHQEAEYIASKMDLVNMVDKVSELEMKVMSLEKMNADLTKLLPKSKRNRKNRVNTFN